MNDFTKNIAQALFNQDKINDLLHKELQQAVNDLLEAELTAFLGYDLYARDGWNTGNSRNGAYFRKVDTQFGEIEIQVPRDRNGMFEGCDEFLLPWNYGNKHVDPTMEPNEDVVARMRRAVLEILDQMDDNETALVVGHGDILARYVRDATSEKDFAGFKNAAVVKLTFEGKKSQFDDYVWPAKDVE